MEGWNDPPKNVGQPTGNLKINLNKRVAFPLSSASATQSSQTASPLLLPPMPPSIANVENKSIEKTSESSIDQAEDVELRKEKVMQAFENRLDELSATVKPSISSKLKTLDAEWENLGSEIKVILKELSEHLDTKDVKCAAASHRKIVMKGCNRPWVIAIRAIIMNMETSNEKTSPPEEDSATNHE